MQSVIHWFYLIFTFISICIDDILSFYLICASLFLLTIETPMPPIDNLKPDLEKNTVNEI